VFIAVWKEYAEGHPHKQVTMVHREVKNRPVIEQESVHSLSGLHGRGPTPTASQALGGAGNGSQFQPSVNE
jgi:hypothetical protein